VQIAEEANLADEEKLLKLAEENDKLKQAFIKQE